MTDHGERLEHSGLDSAEARMSDTDDSEGVVETRHEPREPTIELGVDELALSVEDAEALRAQAAVFRAAAASGGQPLWRAETLARAIALENIAAQATETAGVLTRGNGGEMVHRLPIDAPWREQEVAKATHDTPTLLNAEASRERLTLARDAGSLALAVDAAEQSGATTPTEQMLTHELATSHALGMKLAARSEAFLAKRFLSYPAMGGDGEAKREQIATIEAARLATASARMMETTGRLALVLDRLKRGCVQTIIVQQKVDVQSGAQAVVNGAVQVEQRRRKKDRRKP